MAEIASMAVKISQYTGRSDCPWPTPERVSAIESRLREWVDGNQPANLMSLEMAYSLLRRSETTAKPQLVTPDSVITLAGHIRGLLLNTTNAG